MKLKAFKFLHKFRNVDNWECPDCKVVSEFQKWMRGRAVACPNCGGIYRLDPYGEEKQSSLDSFDCPFKECFHWGKDINSKICQTCIKNKKKRGAWK